MPYTVTIASGLVDVMLPSGLRAQGGQVAFLSDQEFSQLSQNALTTCFSAIAAASGTPAVTVGPQTPVVTYNPGVEGDNEPSSATTPLNSPAIG